MSTGKGWHHWKYTNHEVWYCEDCKGKTKQPMVGNASKPTCPGTAKKIKSKKGPDRLW